MKGEVRRKAAQRAERRARPPSPRDVPRVERRELGQPSRKTRNSSWWRSNRGYANAGRWCGSGGQSTWWILK